MHAPCGEVMSDRSLGVVCHVFHWNNKTCVIHYSSDEDGIRPYVKKNIMAALVGSLGEFAHSKEAWAAYVERLESYFYVKDTDERKKAALLISVMGATPMDY